jgi:antirestriction protein ArdC
MSNTVYQIVTEKIIEALKAGQIPWRKPWVSVRPMNYKTKRAYTGINTLLLGMLPYKLPYYLSFKQVGEMGGLVKKGEKSHLCVFWKWLEAKDDDGKKKKIPLLRYYNVFNIEQTDLPAPEMPAIASLTPDQDVKARCEAFIAQYQNAPAVIPHPSQAAYSPSLDTVSMPDISLFHSTEEYFGSLFHEFVHSTGHKSRLNREGLMATTYGSERYSKEELVAEIGAAFCCSIVGIEKTFPNQAAYIQGWLSKLNDDKRLILQASSLAQKAVDLMEGKAAFDPNAKPQGEANKPLPEDVPPSAEPTESELADAMA